MQFGQLHHVEYYVNDLPRTKVFWGWFLGKFGYKEYQRWNTGISWAHPTGTYLVFVEVEPDHRTTINNRQAAGLNHIALQGGSNESLLDIATELQQREIRILTQRPDALCFEDPNGFAVEIFAQRQEF